MPLDPNLPTYYFKPPADKHNLFDTTLLFTLFDSEPEPRYILRVPDPSSPQAKNCYAVGLCDPYIPDVVFGEVLVKPEWTQPTLSAEEIRKNGGIPHAPLPVLPREVTVQLYDPDQQVVLEEEKGSWGNSPTYHFSMPQQTFRTPSSSTLDYGASDPAADPSTPQINFLWKRDGRRDLKCFVTGKSTDKGHKKKKGGKEPPIIVAIFSDYKELTIYEPNLHRVEMEDYKGLEIVLLLTGTVVRDIFCGHKKDCFNTGEAPRKNSGGMLNRKPSKPFLQVNGSTANLPTMAPTGVFSLGKKKSQNVLQPSPPVSSTPGVPPPDPRQQWEIDAETARLQRLYNAERQNEEAKRRERQRREEEEQMKIKKMLEQEEKERRRQQDAVDKESARLMKLYGNQANLVPPRPNGQPQRYTYPNLWSSNSAAPPIQPPSQNHARPHAQAPSHPPRVGQGPYLAPHAHGRPPAASHSSFFHGAPQVRPPQLPHRPSAAVSSVNLTMSGANQRPPPLQSQTLRPKKSSFWGFLSGDPAPRLNGQR